MRLNLRCCLLGHRARVWQAHIRGLGARCTQCGVYLRQIQHSADGSGPWRLDRDNGRRVRARRVHAETPYEERIRFRHYIANKARLEQENARLRAALEKIRDSDSVDTALNPERPARLAEEALR